MQVSEVEALVANVVEDAQIMVEGEGCNFTITVVSPMFEGLSLLKKQQSVMSAFSEQIASGELHAISVKAFTPAEWEEKQ